MLKVYTIYDNKKQDYSPPIFMVSEEQLIQGLFHVHNEAKGKLSPHNIEVYYLGLYDQKNGKFQLQKSPQHLFNGAEILKVKTKETQTEYTRRKAKEKASLADKKKLAKEGFTK